MNNLKIVDSEARMNHIELCELINKLRVEEGNEKELMSKNLLAKIRKEVEVLQSLGLNNELNFKPVEYKDAKGEMRPTFLMNRDGVLQMASSESIYVRAKIIEYINALENKLKEKQLQLSERDNAILNIMNATNDLERVGALKQFENIVTKPLIEKNEKLTEEVEVLTPKADIFDKFINSNGLYSSTQVEKLFKLSSAQKLNKMLNEDLHLIYKQGKNWLPYATTNDTWFKLIVGETNGNGYSQLKITSKGVIEIGKLLEIDVDEKELENLL